MAEGKHSSLNYFYISASGSPMRVGGDFCARSGRRRTTLAVILASVCVVLSLTGCSKFHAASLGDISCRVRPAMLTKASESKLDDLKVSGFTMLGIIDENARDWVNDRDYTAGTYIDNKAVTWDETASKWSIADSPKWVENDSMRFWCWTPAAGLSVNPSSVSLIGSTQLPFSYTIAGGNTDSSGNSSDAKSQNDVLFSYNSRWKTGSGTDEVELYFYHALSNIRFCTIPTTGSQTSGDGTFKASYEIVDISLQNVSGSADCTMTGRRSGSPSFTWSGHDETVTYTQYYGAKFMDASSNIVCPDGWTSKVANGKTIYTADEGFFIIPQTIGEDARLAVTFKTSGTTVTKSVTLKGVGTDKWMPGLYYTYGISISSDLVATLQTDLVSMSQVDAEW